MRARAATTSLCLLYSSSHLAVRCLGLWLSRLPMVATSNTAAAVGSKHVKKMYSGQHTQQPVHARSRRSISAQLDTRGWQDLRVRPEELRPNNTLNMGQCFNWRLVGDGVWVGVLGRTALAVRQQPHTTEYHWLGGVALGAEDMAQMLHSYFQLDQSLLELYDAWSGADVRLAQIATVLAGVRVVRQDPLECLVSFICSSNNNIGRITLMLNRLRRKYGSHLLTLEPGELVASATAAPADATAAGSVAGGSGDETALELYSFPTLEQLSRATEQELKDLGFGYRAGYIVATVAFLCAHEHEQGGEAWLHSLRTCSGSDGHASVREQLCQLKGVGPKVADCIALFSLDQTDAIPVDVHVWRIACRDYDPSLRSAKSLTPTIYDSVGQLFRGRFGTHAGWAHSLLFAGELPAFQGLLPEALQQDMRAFKASEKEWKDAKKAAKAAGASARDAIAAEMVDMPATAEQPTSSSKQQGARGGKRSAPRPRKKASGAASVPAGAAAGAADSSGTARKRTRRRASA